MNIFFDFLISNWNNLLLILVGSFALLVYWLQARRKETDAASLILVQIDELQERIKEILSYIVDDKLDDVAFYESQPLFSDDYWNQYKHYFVRRMDSKSYRTISSLYNCAFEIQEQQQLMKNLQKNFFFIKQQVLANLETNYIINGMNNSASYPINMAHVAAGMMKSMPPDLDSAQRNAIENLISQVCNSNGNMDTSLFWQGYNKNHSEIINILDNNALTMYIPVQLRRSIQKAINQYSLLEISGSDGYRKLQKIAKRKF